jgi:hypothetical protein
MEWPISMPCIRCTILGAQLILSAPVGFTQGCRDIDGTPVPYISSPWPPKQGLGTWTPELGPLILIRPDAYQLPPVIFEFLMWHQCGYHALGQIKAYVQRANVPTPSDESDADIWGSVGAVRSGRLTSGEVQQVLTFVGQLPPDAANFSGTVRSQRMAEALKAWSLWP